MGKTGRVALGVVVAALACAAPAAAQIQGTDLVPWPQALPAADVPNDVQAHGVTHCEHPSIRCVVNLKHRLQRQFARFNATCDHRAVISYSYLQITQGLLDDLRGPRQGALVQHRRWMEYLITAFSNRYFRAFHRYAHGLPVTPGWQITFDTAMHGDASAGQEILLFSSVHVQHDLPFAYAKMGIETRSGKSRKPDHDAVNAVNARVFDGIEKFIAAHYDPAFSLIDIPFVPVEEVGTLELIKSWREQGWRSAERLLAAKSPSERHKIAQQIRTTSTVWAQMMSSEQAPGYRDMRDQYCLAHQSSH
jgi:hypothetical protein